MALNALAEIPKTKGHPSPREKHFILPNFTVLGGAAMAYGDVVPVKGGMSRNGFVLGTQIDQPLNENFYLTGGLVYTQRGVRTALFNLMGNDINASVNLDYIDLMFAGKYRFVYRKQGLVPFAEAGFFYSIAVNRNVVVADLLELGLSERFAGDDAGMFFGGGFTFTFPSGIALLGQMRFLAGLKDIDTTDSLFRTRSFQFLTGVQFPF